MILLITDCIVTAIVTVLIVSEWSVIMAAYPSCPNTSSARIPLASVSYNSPAKIDGASPCFETRAENRWNSSFSWWAMHEQVSGLPISCLSILILTWTSLDTANREKSYSIRARRSPEVRQSTFYHDTVIIADSDFERPSQYTPTWASTLALLSRWEVLRECSKHSIE